MNWLKEWIANFLLTASALAVIIMGVFTAGPWIETKYFPVYSKFQLVSAEEYGTDKSRAVFRFSKYRQCELLSFIWMAGELSTPLRPLEIRIERGNGEPDFRPRPVGQYETGRYIIDVPPEVLRTATFGDAYSQCHPLWLTRSAVYP